MTPAVLALSTALSWVVPPAPPCPTEDACRRLQGRVQRAGEGTPLPRVDVLVLPSPGGARTGPLKGTPSEPPAWSARAVTDDEGRFEVPAVPRARVRIVVLVDGYAREDRIVETRRGRPLRLFLRPRADLEYRTVVKAAPDAPLAADVTAHTLAGEELRTIPGAQSDPLRGAQALPGFARAPLGLGLIVLRGAPPTQSMVMLGEHPVRRAFHALPIAAILPSDAIDSLTIVPSNVSARYGPGTGGLVHIEPTHGRRDGHHGHVEADVISVGASQEGPVGRGSYFAGVRRAHLEAALSQVERLDPALVFPRPSFWDYQAILGGPIGRGVRLEAAAFGSGDSVDQRAQFPQYPGAEQLLAYHTQMHRPSLTLTATRGPFRVLASQAVLVASDRFELPDVEEVERRDVQPSWRFEVETRLHRSASFLVGTDGLLVRRRGSLTHYRMEQNEDRERVLVADTTTGRGTDTNLAVYALVDLHTGPVRVVPGVRAQAFTVGARSTHATDPRLSIEIAAGERVRLRAGVGTQSQPQTSVANRSSAFIEDALGFVASRLILPPVILDSFEPKIPLDDGETTSALALRRALHVSAGGEVDLPAETTLGATVFSRLGRAHGFLSPVVDGSPLGVTVDEERTRTLGGELLLRKRLTRHFYGWIAYTVMKNAVKDVDGWHPGDFDQRHNLSLVASYGLPRNVRIGARFRLVSGAPYTPVAALSGIPQDVDGAIRPGGLVFGPRNSGRLPVFHQLDLRVDKRWYVRRITIAFYVDVQNVYNRTNPEVYVYDWDFTSTIGSISLPIIPSLGLRVDW